MNLTTYVREMDGRNRCDLSRLLRDAAALREVVDRMARPFLNASVTHVAAIDAMGFALGGAVAVKLNAGLVLLRKSGKSAWAARSAAFADYSGEDKSLDVVADALDEHCRVLIVDDWSETGAQLRAAVALCEAAGAAIVGAAVLNADAAVRCNPPPGLPIIHSVFEY